MYSTDLFQFRSCLLSKQIRRKESYTICSAFTSGSFLYDNKIIKNKNEQLTSNQLSLSICTRYLICIKKTDHTAICPPIMNQIRTQKMLLKAYFCEDLTLKKSSNFSNRCSELELRYSWLLSSSFVEVTTIQKYHIFIF